MCYLQVNHDDYTRSKGFFNMQIYSELKRKDVYSLSAFIKHCSISQSYLQISFMKWLSINKVKQWPYIPLLLSWIVFSNVSKFPCQEHSSTQHLLWIWGLVTSIAKPSSTPASDIRSTTAKSKPSISNVKRNCESRRHQMTPKKVR